MIWLLQIRGLSVLLFLVAREREAFERHYAVEHVLGSGGFGTVYAGIRRKDGKPVSWSGCVRNPISHLAMVFAFDTYVCLQS